MKTPEELRRQSEKGKRATALRVAKENEKKRKEEEKGCKEFSAAHKDQWIQEIELELDRAAKAGRFEIDFYKNTYEKERAKYLWRLMYDIGSLLQINGYKVRFYNDTDLGHGEGPDIYSGSLAISWESK